LNFAAGVAGIDITGESVTISDLNLLSASTGAGTDDGIRNRGNPTTLQRISISHFGRHGVITLGNFPTNADSFHYSDMQSAHNFGDGYQWGTPCTDNHLGKSTLLTSSLNAGWGFNVLCGEDNKFEETLVQGNTLGGYHVSDGDNYFFDVYAESGTGSSFIVDNGAPGVRAWFAPFGQPATITPGFGNQINFWDSASAQLAQNQLVLSPMPGSPGATVYRFDSGDFANSDLALWDLTHANYVWHYNPAGPLWEFFKPVKVPSLQVGHVVPAHLS
jgi:hypothetical protein